MKHQKKGLTESEMGKTLAQIYEALAYLHDHDIVHGRLYPGNILCDNHTPGMIQLSEIALAAYIDLGDPEQIEFASQKLIGGLRIPGPRCNVWSAGVIGLLPEVLPPPSCRDRNHQSEWVRKLSRLAASENDHRRRKFRSGCDDENAEATAFLEKVLQIGIEDRPAPRNVCSTHGFRARRKMLIR
jgi:serine/threonine protein kinase